MSEQIYIISDIHGCFKTLKALLRKLPKSARLCFVGDLIDRGKDSDKVVEFVRSGGHLCVLGNHERALLLAKNEFLLDKSVDNPWFNKHGGAQTFATYKGKNELKLKHLEFLQTLPTYIEFENFLTADGRKLVVSHSAVGKIWKERHNDKETEKFKTHLLSGRGDISENDDIFNIYGHEVMCEPVITKGRAAIDLGGVYRHSKRDPRICAIAFPSLKIFTQKNVER
ncbi:metallophosphoesterase [Campylobacter sp. 9BO]|uniref:metallophosphoesterase n=1 Tax=Campylobacter sp. 9BO TaxID=3424759 RepID=UPI003D346FA2